MAGRPWYAQYPDDYERKTSHLTMVQHGAYRLLLDQYYKTGRPLPADVPTLQRMCRAASTVEKQAISAVLAEYFSLEDDGWHNKRADEELQKANNISAKRSDAACKRHSKQDANASANAEQMHTHSTSTATPSSEPVGSSDGCAPQAAALPQTETQKAKPSRSKPKTQLPEQFPDEKALEDARQFWGANGRPDLIPRLPIEAEQFRDHHLKNATLSANWPASWRTWYRNTPDFVKLQNSNQSRISAHDKGSIGLAAWADHATGFADRARTSEHALPANGHEPGQVGAAGPRLLGRLPAPDGRTAADVVPGVPVKT